MSVAKLSKANIPLHLRNSVLNKKFENVFNTLVDTIDNHKVIFVYGKPSLDKEIFIVHILKHFINKGYNCLYCLPYSIESYSNYKVTAIMHLEAVIDIEAIKKIQDFILNSIYKDNLVIIDCKDETRIKNLLGEDFCDYLFSVGIGVEVNSDVSITIIKE